MLSQISWSTYWICMICALSAWYLYVGIAYFKSEILGYLKSGLPSKKPKPVSAAPVLNKASVLGSFGANEDEDSIEPDTNEQASWEPAPVGNAQYAAVAAPLAKGVDLPLPLSADKALADREDLSLAQPSVEQGDANSEQVPAKPLPLEDIDLEVSSQEQLVVDSFSLSTCIDASALISFLTLHTSSADEPSPTGMAVLEIDIDFQEEDEIYKDSTFSNT